MDNFRSSLIPELCFQKSCFSPKPFKPLKCFVSELTSAQCKCCNTAYAAVNNQSIGTLYLSPEEIVSLQGLLLSIEVNIYI